MVNQRKSSEGFTIIEVMIVLVVAAVIIVIVFLAVPALQRNVRNTQRKRDAAQLATLIRECLNNNFSDINRCRTPQHINFNQSMFSMYSGVHYGSSVFPSADGAEAPPTLEEPNWLFGLQCNAALTWFTEEGAVPKDFVVGYFLETPSGVIGRCLDG